MGFFSTCTIHCHNTFSCPSECFIHLKLSNFPHFFWLASSRNYLCLPYLHYEGKIIDFNRLGRLCATWMGKTLDQSQKSNLKYRLMSKPTTHIPPSFITSIMPIQLRGEKLFLLWKFMHVFCKPPSSLTILGSYLESSTISWQEMDILNTETKHMKFNPTTYSHVLSHAAQNT